MGWTEESIEQLREMWAQGLTANEIAKRLGVTKNAIVGKVHRLCLQARPSPIKTKDNENISKPELAVQTGEPKTTEIEDELEEIIDVETADVSVTISTPKKLSGSNVRLIELDSHTCRWPIGDPRDEDFCFCGKKVRAGQTYCDEHSALAYVKVLKK